MNWPYAIQNLLNFPLFNTGSRQQKAAAPRCPQCDYVLDRPHSLACSRCGASIPLAQGCNGCGKCRNG